MKYLVQTEAPSNPAACAALNRFDGTQANDGRTMRLLASLASVAADHTGDKLARQMIHNATAALFDAAARLDRLGAANDRPQIEGRAQVLAVANG